MHRAVLLLVACLVAACGSGGAGSPRAGDPPVRGDWELVEWTADGAPVPVPAGARATLLIGPDRLDGVSFCNHFGGGYRLRSGGVHLAGDLGVTAMGCAPDVMAAETAYLRALGSAHETATVEGGRLVLTGGGVVLRFRPIPPVPTRELAGTEWVLETLIQGDVASSVAGRPVLLLAADGTFTGSTGCRTLSGTWVTVAGEVRFPDLHADGQCPADRAAQDAAVLDVLGDGFRAAITGDRLTATAASGRALGLVYRAGVR